MGTTDQGFDSGIRIGTTLGNMETVKVEPRVIFNLGPTVDVVCGDRVPMGYPECVWEYGDIELSGEQYYQLWKQTSGSASGDVYIRIPTREISVATYTPVYATYQGVMRWPEEGVTRGMYNRWLVPELEFTNLVAVS
jgi:hypothetical protein